MAECNKHARSVEIKKISMYRGKDAQTVMHAKPKETHGSLEKKKIRVELRKLKRAMIYAEHKKICTESGKEETCAKRRKQW